MMLRERTRSAHDRVDAAFGRFDLADRLAYGEFLAAQAAAILPVEERLTATGAAQISPAWQEHRRARLLLADLASLGLKLPPLVGAPVLPCTEAVAGALYVLEGSRLGAKLLSRTVPAAFPSSFLNAPQDAGRWAGFVKSLDLLLDTPHRQGVAVAAALETFACFERAVNLASTA